MCAKIRSNFVSNSSSASFIVTLKNTEKDYLLNSIFDDMGWVPYLRDKVQKDADYYEKRHDYENERRLSLLEFIDLMDKYENTSYDDYEELEKLQSLLAEKYLDYNGIKIKIKKDTIELNQWVAMFNDYSDISDVLKNISMRYLDDKKNLIEFKIFSN